MTWPQLINVPATCPRCNRRHVVEAIHFPLWRHFSPRDRTSKSSTWADCPACGFEWLLNTTAHQALPAC